MLPDGRRIDAGTAEAARAIRDDLLLAATQKEAQQLIAVAQAWVTQAPAGTARTVDLTGERVTSDGTKIIHRRGGQVTREFTGPEMLAAVREEAAVLAGQSGHVAIDVIINGSNTVQFGKKVAGGARDLVQRLELHRGADGVSTLETFYHEQVEADWKANLLRGTITLEETQRALGGLAATFHPEQARTPVERALAERVQRIAHGEANETETRETLSELASADLLGRVPEGGARHGAGSVSVALDAAARSARDQQTVTAVGKVRAFLGSVQRKFQAVLDTLALARGAQRPEHPHAAALAQARHTGQAADYDALMSKVLGLEETTERIEAEKSLVDDSTIAAGLTYSLEPLGVGPRALTSPPSLLASQPNPFASFHAQRPGEWRAIWKDWIKLHRSEWKGTAYTPEGMIEITNQALDHASFVHEGESPALHFEAAVRMKELLEHSVLTMIDAPRDYEHGAIEVHRRYAWMRFADNQVRNVLLTVKRLRPEFHKPDSDIAYSLEALRVTETADGKNSPTILANTRADTGSSEEILEAFLRGVKPEHQPTVNAEAELQKHDSLSQPNAGGNPLDEQQPTPRDDRAAAERITHSISLLKVEESLADASNDRLEQVRAALPKLNPAPRLETPQDALLWFEKHLAGKTILTSAGFEITIKPGHFSVLTAGKLSAGKSKGFVEGFASAEEFRIALREGRVKADQIPGYDPIRARDLQHVEVTLTKGQWMRSIEHPAKISFVSSVEGLGYVVVTLHTEEGHIGLLSGHPRELNDTFLRRYEIGALSDAGSERDSR